MEAMKITGLIVPGRSATVLTAVVNGGGTVLGTVMATILTIL
jgi:hypothetical protein